MKENNMCNECLEKHCICDELLDEDFDTLTDIELDDIVKSIGGN